MQPNRKEFLRLMAAAAWLRPVAPASAQPAAPGAETQDQFTVRVLEDCGAALRCALCYIGDRVGLFRAMASSGPVTATELARQTQLNERLVREWLNGLTAAGYLEYRPTDKTYLLSPEHASVLANEEFSRVPGLFQLIESLVSAAPKVAHAFQTGKPVTADDFTADLNLGGRRASAPDYKHHLVQEWIPLLPHVQQALVAGATAVDVGCGEGLASVVLAKAFPKSRFAGYDPYEPAIRFARELARKEGVADRVEFVAADASKLPADRFELVTIFISLHHFNDPVSTLRQCRHALKPGGTCFIVDFDLPLNPAENINLAGRLAYPLTTLYCLHDSMANQGAGIGSELNETVLNRMAVKSGFPPCRKLAGSTPVSAYYELRA
jgi:2-polyprenyl-3-methyl-5-hydroxy-6-metoxy-1,4-benzoquinol methylase